MARFLSAVVSVCLFNPIFTTAQSSTQTSTPQPKVLLQQSLAALVGNTQISDITLTGTVRRIAGSDDETGSATLMATSDGSTQMNFAFSSGSASEVANFSGMPAATWSGPDGAAHSVALHNLLAESAWFSPAVAIKRRLLPSSSYVVTYVAHETINSQALEHISVSQTASFADPPGAPTFAHLCQVDFYLDSTTFLPAAISFNIHPDNNALVDIPVRVLFSDYRSVSGAQIPFHIQKFLNNTLYLDLQLDQAELNTGIAIAQVGAQ